jgi:hypothetical protein
MILECQKKRSCAGLKVVVALASARKPDTTYESLFKEIEGHARAQGKGMWKK